MDFEEGFLDIEKIRVHVRQGDVVWRDHAMKRLRERKISRGMFAVQYIMGRLLRIDQMIFLRQVV